MRWYCPECWSDDQLKYGDGDATPALYCDRCGIGWDDLPNLEKLCDDEMAEAEVVSDC